MATSTCSNCSPSQCGCTPGSYTVVPPCPPACSEVFNASCIVYTGVDLLCNTDTVISRNDYLDTVITKLVNYICSTVAPPASVVAGSAFIDVVPTTDPVTSVTTYTVSVDMAAMEIWVAPIITNQILAKVLAGPGIDVAPDAVAGTVTVSHEDTSSVTDLSSNNTGNSFIQSVNFTFDTYGHVTGASAVPGTVVNADNFGQFDITDTDPGTYTWASVGSAIATNPGDTFTVLSGESIDVDVDVTALAMRIAFTGLTTGTGLSGVGTAADPLVNSAPNVDQNLWSEIVAKDGTTTTASTTTDTLTITGGGAIETTISGDTLTINNGGVTDIIADEGINVSAATGSVTVRNTGALFTTKDVKITGGVVVDPVAGAVDVSSSGISSQYMNAQLYTLAGALVTHDSTVWNILGMGTTGPGQFEIANTGLADGDYVLAITGNLQ